MATINLGRIKPVFRGAYSGATAYVIDDIVTSGDETFICILASTGNATSNATYWTKLAAKGTDGTDVSTTLTTQGDILYRDGSGLQRLAKPASTMNLQMTSGGVASWAAVDLTSIRQDISTLALHSAVADNKGAYNLTDSFIDQFEDDTGIGTESTADRHEDEYLGAFTTTTATGVTINSSNHATYFPSASKLWWTATSNSGYDYTSLVNTGCTPSGTFPADAFSSSAVGSGSISGARYNMLRFDWGTSKLKPTSFRYKVPSGFTHNQNMTSGGWNTNPASIGTAPSDYEQFATNSTVSNGSTYGNSSISTSTYYTQFSIRSYDADSISLSEIVFIGDTQTTTTAASGNIISIANVPTTTNQTEVSGVMLYKDTAGTATLGGGSYDLKIEFTCDGGSNWTEAASYTAVTPVFSSGIKMVKLGKTTCTQGNDVRYRVSWANQSAGSKETHVYGMALNY